MTAFPPHTSNSNTKNMCSDTTFLMYNVYPPRTPHRNHFSIIFTTDLQDGHGRWEMIVLGEIKSEFSGMEKLSDLPMITQGVNQGRWPRPLTPLVFSHFTLEPVQLSRICFSQQISVFPSKSCQFFFPRWAMNLPRVSKQTVERALAFEPE